jgi:hypothetical protein
MEIEINRDYYDCFSGLKRRKKPKRKRRKRKKKRSRT